MEPAQSLIFLRALNQGKVPKSCGPSAAGFPSGPPLDSNLAKTEDWIHCVRSMCRLATDQSPTDGSGDKQLMAKEK